MPRGVKTRANNTWTESRYFSFIRSALSQAWSRYPVKHQFLKSRQKPYSGSDKRTKFEYDCEECKQTFKGKDVQVDHIKPAGSLLKYEDLPSFVENLFCEVDNLQLLCKECHKKKTAEERKNARLAKKN